MDQVIVFSRSRAGVIHVLIGSAQMVVPSQDKEDMHHLLAYQIIESCRLNEMVEFKTDEEYGKQIQSLYEEYEPESTL